MREAPASAIMTIVICCETWPIGFTKDRDSVSSEMIVPIVNAAPEKLRLPQLPSAARPPKIAEST